MATTYWLGTADAVAQVDTVQITADDASTTYILTVGAQTISTAGSGTGVNATATALAAAWNASTGPYFSNVTASAATDTVTLTADTAGVPFVTTSSVTGGTGTIGAVAASVANAGPNSWDVAGNWSGAAVPIATNDVIIADTSTNICWGLAQGTIALNSLTILKTYTGKIGLDYTKFATSADGDTTVSTEFEYREQHLTIEATTVDIGQHFGQGSPLGSGRINLDLDSGTAATVTIHDTASNPSETGRGAVRLLSNNSSTNIFIRSAPGGVAIANELPGETSTVGKVSVNDATTGSRVVLGDGVTITTWAQRGGTNTIQAAATITTVTVDGGVLNTEGDYTITTMTVNGGTVNASHKKTSGVAITTLNLNTGTVETRGSGQARTYTTVNMKAGGTLKANAADLTITTLNEPTTGEYTLSAT